MDVGWRKNWVAAAMDVLSSKKWGACTGIFIVLMLVMFATPHGEDCHDFADQRTHFLGIPNTLNVVSTIPFFFVGLAGLILNHCKSYFKLRSSQGCLYTLFFAGISVVGFGSSRYHLNPKNATLFCETLLMMIAFTSFEAIFIIERFDEWAGTKSVASTSYWLWAAGFYVLARVEEVANKPIYRWTLQIVSGHTLGYLCAAMVPLFLILMLVKRTPIEPERHRIPMHHQLKLIFMVCLLLPKIICLWLPKIQVGAIMYEISILMWEFNALYVSRPVNQAKISEESSARNPNSCSPNSVGPLSEEHHRAKILREYIEHSSFLILIDNVQDGYYPDLIAVGLPIALGRRQKVVIASRSQFACGRMGCTISNTMEMKCLGDEDAWSLFKYHAGVEITEADTEIYEFAKKMVSACEGLPRAIYSIGIGVAGATCRGKHPVDWWSAYKRFKDKNLPPERMEEIVAVLV